jgi:hypothetical protein
MRIIQFETRTHQGGSKKIFLFIFHASPAKFGSSMLSIPLVKF